MKKYSLAIPILCVLLFFACGGNPGKTDEQKSVAQAGNVLEPLKLPRTFYMKFKGSIGDDLAITVDLQRDSSGRDKETYVSGSYYYDRVGMPLYLHGDLKNGKDLVLHETDKGGKNTGLFTGAFTGNNTIEGTWENPKTKKTLPFKLTLTTENVAGARFANYHKENCSIAMKNRKKPADSLNNFTDTMCSYIDLSMTEIMAKDPVVTKKINAAILKATLSYIDSTVKTVNDALNSIDKLEDYDFLSLDNGCSIASNEPNILGISVWGSSFAGGAHPNSFFLYYNYDMTSGNAISLTDLFIASYKKDLDKIAEKKFLEQNDKDAGWNFEPGQFSLNDNFLITRGGLVFQFNQYEIGAYALGAPEVFIPYKDILLLLKPGSIVSGYLPKP